MNIKDLCVVITGGASGLGSATAERLSELGARVAIFDLNEEAGARLAERLGGSFHHVDVTSAEYRELWHPYSYEPWSAEIEVFHNPNAAHPLPDDLLRTSLPLWEAAPADRQIISLLPDVGIPPSADIARLSGVLRSAPRADLPSLPDRAVRRGVVTGLRACRVVMSSNDGAHVTLGTSQR